MDNKTYLDVVLIYSPSALARDRLRIKDSWLELHNQNKSSTESYRARSRELIKWLNYDSSSNKMSMAPF